MKIVIIDGENLHIFRGTSGISMKFSGKIFLIIILKATKKPGLYPLSRRHNFGRTAGGSSN